jgi:hypothetical protein
MNSYDGAAKSLEALQRPKQVQAVFLGCQDMDLETVIIGIDHGRGVKDPRPCNVAKIAYFSLNRHDTI